MILNLSQVVYINLLLFIKHFSLKVLLFVLLYQRLFDYHPDAIPAPYPHSNVDSDEVIFYSKGNFVSRSGISLGSVTYHPMGLPHGPQPGKYEDSIGKKVLMN